MSFIIPIIIFLAIIGLLGISIISSILRGIFGIGRSFTNQTQSKNAANTKDNFSTNSKGPKQHKKLFDKDEGEYVDFEEIKD